uniref:Uncharacterized protein n=1 Tax=Anguilla anguilla TaxID=7936 RepID=A0A0E9R9W3_ANGAN
MLKCSLSDLIKGYSCPYPVMHLQMLGIFLGEVLPGLYCSHLQFLFVSGDFCLSVFSKLKSMFSWI